VASIAVVRCGCKRVQGQARSKIRLQSEHKRVIARLVVEMLQVQPYVSHHSLKLCRKARDGVNVDSAQVTKLK